MTTTVIGTLLRIIYDMLFWADGLPVSGRNQPLLIVLEEAHLYLQEGRDSPAHRTITAIAKQGRKFGVGLCVVTQRPSEIDATVLSQCGTLIALRTTSDRDRAKIEAAMPDDLGNLSKMLPSLRTGEALVIGEAMPIPSRILFRRSERKLGGTDPDVPTAWRRLRPDARYYTNALASWRHRSTAASDLVENARTMNKEQ